MAGNNRKSAGKWKFRRKRQEKIVEPSTSLFFMAKCVPRDCRESFSSFLSRFSNQITYSAFCERAFVTTRDLGKGYSTRKESGKGKIIDFFPPRREL